MTIQAAAENLAKASAKLIEELSGWNGDQNSIYVDGFDYEWLVECAKHTAKMLDETPIDEAWLRSVGFGDDWGDLQLCGPIEDLRMTTVTRDKEGVWLVGGGTESHQSMARISPVTSRGQLRMLCASLGVTLKEQPNG